MSAMTETGEELAAPASNARTIRPYYWSMRRELWEHRSLYVAPLVAALVVLAGFLLNAVHLPEGIKVLQTLDEVRQRSVTGAIYVGISLVIGLTALITAGLYCLDALRGERRDKSVLFWRSLPVPDTTAVLSKLSIALAVMPAIAFVIVLITGLLLLLLSSAVLLAGGVGIAPIWANLQLFQLTVLVLYMFLVVSLWYAPIYAWFLLVSAWARRAVLLWALLPPFGAMLFERLAFNTSYIARFLGHRVQGASESAFIDDEALATHMLDGEAAGAHMLLPQQVLEVATPLEFLSDLHLWGGLAAAAALVAATVWMRRYREPM